ncbi:hypothetical protein C6W92_16645 [Roseovarius sp. A46]|uniref:hypothetical protein n=1 Tax=Roseovarius sp. A46 TaxID=2109331 RepID=UPI001012A596|nr:hypothetical protein [Roseovarius sp. A46]RXV58551.1 hypothetical protein C6W92_16645 [Roseovarius sp. A46]
MTEMLRYNTGKLQLYFFPSSVWRVLMANGPDDLSSEMILGIARVLEFGAKTYSKDKWRSSRQLVQMRRQRP